MKRKNKIIIIIGSMIAVTWCIICPRAMELILGGNIAYEEIYYRSQIISSVFVIFGVIVAVWQYVLAVRSANETRNAELKLHQKEIAQMECERVQKAIDLAEYYKDEILDKFAVVMYVFRKVGLLDILNTVKQSDIKAFDMNEFERLFSVAQRKEIEKKIKSDEIVQYVIETEMILGEEMNLKKYSKIIFDEKTGEEREVFNAQGIHKEFMSNTVNVLMNNLEFFAMHFTHKTADETVVFQSLHQTYLMIVQYLYYNIAKHNTGSTKYYTNVIELYEIWYKEAASQNELMTTKSKGTIIKGTIAEMPK